MKDNEIIKALECCRKKECNTCPCYDDEIECGEMLIGHTLDLINRQKAEIESLQFTVEQQALDIKEFQKRTEQMAKCIVSLDEKNRTQSESINQVAKLFVVDSNKIRTEAIKEFAKKLKLVLHTTTITIDDYLIISRCIDNLVKEMTEQSVNYGSSKTEVSENE